MAQMAGPKMLEVPPIRTWADITDQNVGTNAIRSAPKVSAPMPAAIRVRFWWTWSTKAPAGVWERIPAIPPTVSATPTRSSFHP